MDLYSSMPPVKTAAASASASVYTASPHVLDQSELSNQSLARSDVTKYTSDILTSSAWSAVIHHPAEDSEPDELPSTVDIDAIKEPPTPLPAGPCTPGTMHSPNDGQQTDDDDEDSESDSDDPDSDSESGNESNTESEEEDSRGTWSESESEAASDASHVAVTPNRRRQRTPKTSSSEEEEADEELDGGGGGGGRRRKQVDNDQVREHYYRSHHTDPSNPMKVKISAMKFTAKHKSTTSKGIAAAAASDSSSDNDRRRGGGGVGGEEDSSADERRWEEEEEAEEEDSEQKKRAATKHSSIFSSGNPSPIKQSSKIGPSAIEIEKYSKYSSLQSDRESLRSAAAAFRRRRTAPSNRNSYHGSSNSDSSRTGSSRSVTTHRGSPSKLEDSRIISDHSSNSDLSRTGYRDSPSKHEDTRIPKSSYHGSNSDLSRTGYRDSPSKLEDARIPKSSYHGSNSDLSRTGYRDAPSNHEETRIPKSSYHGSNSDSGRTGGASRTGSYRDSPSKHEDTRISKSSYHGSNSDSGRTGVSRTGGHRDSPIKMQDSGRTSSCLHDSESVRTGVASRNKRDSRKGGDFSRTKPDSDNVRASNSRGNSDLSRKTDDEVENSPLKSSRKERHGQLSSDSRNVSRGNSSSSKNLANSEQRSRDHGTRQTPVTSSSGGGTASSIRLRSSRKKPVEIAVSAIPVPPITAASKQRNAAFDAKKGSEVSSSNEDGDDEEEEEEEEEEKGGREDEKDEITQLAQQLARPSSTLPIPEHLQEINQEDLAAILPDVGGGPFDEFDDGAQGGSSGGPSRKSRGGGERGRGEGERGGGRGEGGGRGTRGGGGGGCSNRMEVEASESSSSDMEMLPDVSDVINRIDSMHDDSEGGGGGHAVNKMADNDDDDGDDDDDDDDVDSEADEVGYSSNLLQRFNQQTEQICSGNRSLPAAADAAAATGYRNRPALELARDAGTSRSRRKGRAPKSTVAAGVTSSSSSSLAAPPLGGVGVVAMPAELEAYCQLASNVSPDSGIQSVAGSPAHQSHGSQSPAANAAPGAGLPTTANRRHHSPATATGLPTASAATAPLSRAANSRKQQPGDGGEGGGRHFGCTPEPITKDAKLTKLYTTSDELRVGEGGKRGPGRPSKREGHSSHSSKKKSHLPSNKEQHHHLSCDNMLKVPPFYKDKSSLAIKDLPRLHGMMVPNKRGPGRPKKSPPTLEPNLPIVDEHLKSRKDHHHHHHKHHHHHHHQVLHSNSNSSLLNEICEQVSKRLDIAAVDEKPSISINGELKHKSKSSHHRKHKHHRHHHHKTASLQLDQSSNVSPLKVNPSLVVNNGTRKDLPRHVALPKSFAIRHHKHKKQKKARKSVEVKVDPSFLMDLDQLVDVFDRLCHIKLPTTKSPAIDVKKSTDVDESVCPVPEKLKVADGQKTAVPSKSSKSKKRKGHHVEKVGKSCDKERKGQIFEKVGKTCDKERKGQNFEKVGKTCDKERKGQNSEKVGKSCDKERKGQNFEKVGKSCDKERKGQNSEKVGKSCGDKERKGQNFEKVGKTCEKERKGHVEKERKGHVEKEQTHEVAQDAQTQHQQASSAVPAVVKRRLKKTAAVETPKNRGDKPEANNEQRLPLKKRHYHNMSSTPNASGSVSSESSPDSSISDAATTGKISSNSSSSKSKQSDSSSLTSSEKSAAKTADTKSAASKVEKPADKSSVGAKVSVGGKGGGSGSSTSCGAKGNSAPAKQDAKSSVVSCTSSLCPESSRSPATLKLSAAAAAEHRDSIDAAIEACITKYSEGDSSAAGSVITTPTPKKRHRPDVDEKKEKGAASAAVQQVKSITKPLAPSTQSSTSSSSSPSQPASKRVSSRSLSQSSTSLVTTSATKVAVTTTVTVPGKRTSSRITAPVTTTTSTPSSQNVTSKGRVSARSSSAVESSTTNSSSCAVPVAATPKRLQLRSGGGGGGGGISTSSTTSTVTTTSCTTMTTSKCDKTMTTSKCDKTMTTSKCDKTMTTSKCDKTMTTSKCDNNKRVSLRVANSNPSSKRGGIATNPVDASDVKLGKTLQVIVSDCDSVVAAAVAVAPSTRSSSAASTKTSLVDQPLITPIPDVPAQKSRQRLSSSQKPPAGVFEPSTKIDDLVSLPKIPPLSPAVKPAGAKTAVVNHVLNKLTERLKGLEEFKSIEEEGGSVSRSLRTKRSTTDDDGDDIDEQSSKSSKKRKLLKDVRVQVTKLLPSDLVVTTSKVVATSEGEQLQPVKKVKRRKAINRTGFPVKKKKKKKTTVVTTVVEDADEVKSVDVSGSLPPPILEDQTKMVLPFDVSSFVDDTPALSPMTTPRTTEEELLVVERTRRADEASELLGEPEPPPIAKRESARQKNYNNNHHQVAPDIKTVILELKTQKDSVMAAAAARKRKENAKKIEEEREGLVRLTNTTSDVVKVEDRRTNEEEEGKGAKKEEVEGKGTNEEEARGTKKEEARGTKKEEGKVTKKEEEEGGGTKKEEEEFVTSRRPTRKVVLQKSVGGGGGGGEEKKEACKEETEMKENVEESRKKKENAEDSRRKPRISVVEKKTLVVERKSLKDITSCDRKQKDKVKREEEEEVVANEEEEEEEEGNNKKVVETLKEEMETVVEKKTRKTSSKETMEVERNGMERKRNGVEVERHVKDKVKKEEVLGNEDDSKEEPDHECKEKRPRVAEDVSKLRMRDKCQSRRRRDRAEASKRRKRKRNGLMKGAKEAGRRGRMRTKRMRKMKNGDRLDGESDVEEGEEEEVEEEEALEESSAAPSSVRRRKKVSLPRWRKRYLTAGLFSDLYKSSGDAPDEVRRTSLDAASNSRIYRPEEHRWGLMPPPIYCAKWVRQRRVHFQLPHDLWWLHKHSRLPGRDVVPSWNHKKIRTNVYYDVKPTYMYEAQACNCNIPTSADQVPTLTESGRRQDQQQQQAALTASAGRRPSGCGEDCINRLIYTECSPRLCPCRQLCSNQRIQRHEWAPGLVKFMTPNKGWGVKTKQSIRSGEFILEYVGEVVSEREFKARMASRYHSDTHHYCLNLDGGLVIDGHRMGGDGRFVNHSCEPNCEMQKWSVNGLFRMALFALRDIRPHEELTYDYNFALFNPAEGQPCKCGSSNCRGVIGGKYQRVSVNKESQDSGAATSTAAKFRKKSRKSQVDPKNGQNKTSVGNTAAKETVNKETQASGSSQVGSTATVRANRLLLPKPLSTLHQEVVRSSRVFLLRNFEKVKRCRERLKQRQQQQPSVKPASSGVATAATEQETKDAAAITQPPAADAALTQPATFLSQLNALSTLRNVRTRRFAHAQNDPQVTRVAKLAHLLKGLHAAVATAKDDNGEQLASSFTVTPSKRRQPDYHERIEEPIDLQTIDAQIKSGHYRSLQQFDADMSRLLANAVRYYGRSSPLGGAALRLRGVYGAAKRDSLPQIEAVLGEAAPASFVHDDDDRINEQKGGGGGEEEQEEDVIRCVCGMYRDEGLMIQCERCLVWQHCDCVKADAGVEHYLCERCNVRPVDLEIKYDTNPEYATEGQTHYMTLLRGELQVRQGDTVYVLRDITNEETGSSTTPPSKHNYKTIKVIDYNDCDIFRIERLWKDEKGGRFVFGHHYLRPHETYHEPTRKFFVNEVMRVPLYEVVPIELVMGHCYVLDPNTYCKGRPIDADMAHVYICEYRVDKCARLFAKLAKPKQPAICTKSYAFEKYEQRLKISRTYTPHGPPPASSASTQSATAKSAASAETVSRSRGGKTSTAHDETQQQQPRDHNVMTSNAATNTTAANTDAVGQLPVARRADQKQRLNGILLKLLARVPSKQVLDISYLLEPGRRNRKRPALLCP